MGRNRFLLPVTYFWSRIYTLYGVGSTRLVMAIKNIYNLWGRRRFHLPVTYFPKNLVYPFTLRLTGINICINICLLNISNHDESIIPFYSTSYGYTYNRQKEAFSPTEIESIYVLIYTLWGQKRFHMPVTYFPTTLVYPFTLRVTGHA